MACKKKAFQTKKEAEERLKQIKAKGGGNKKPRRSYECKECGLFHLTSWSKQKKKVVEDKNIIRGIEKKERDEEYWRKKNGWE